MNKKTVIIALSAVLAVSLGANAVLAVMLTKEKEDPNRYLYDPDSAIGSGELDDAPSGEETTEPRTEIATDIITLSLPESVHSQLEVGTEQNDENVTVTVKAKG